MTFIDLTEYAQLQSHRTVNIYLDDERQTPENMIRVKTADECIQLLRECYANKIKVGILSLDHDLGPPEAGTGYDVICWLEEQIFTNELFPAPEKLNIHSMNSAAVPKMWAAVKAIENMVVQRNKITS